MIFVVNFIARQICTNSRTFKITDLGTASRVVCDKDTTTIIGGAGSKQAIEGRCQELRRMIEKATSEYDKEKLQQRLAKLSGGVAVLRVGAPSEAFGPDSTSKVEKFASHPLA